MISVLFCLFVLLTSATEFPHNLAAIEETVTVQNSTIIELINVCRAECLAFKNIFPYRFKVNISLCSFIGKS